MSEKLVLIDGHSILHRAYFGIPDLTNASGLHTNAIYGFLNILFKLLEEEKPQYLVVTFDRHAPTFRHKMYEAYKGTRKPMEDELRQQIPVMKELLRAMNITIAEMDGYEADDLMGTLAKRAEAEGIEVSLVSGDRDLLQIATDHIRIRIPKTKRNGTEIEDYYAKDVLEKMEVTPEEFIDLKALMGDTADNIPGVPGIGVKTGTNIIKAYHNIENAYEHVEEIKPNKARENLKEFYDQAVLSKKLATIDIDAPVEIDLKKDALFSNPYTGEAYKMCRELELKTFLKRFESADGAGEETVEFIVVTDLSEAERFFAGAEEKEAFGVSIVPCEEGILACAFSDAKGVVIIESEGFVTSEYLKDKLVQLAKKVEIYALDLKSIVNALGIGRDNKRFDCSIAAYLLNPLANSYTYDDLAKTYLDKMFLSESEIIKKATREKAFEDDRENLEKLIANEAYVVYSSKSVLADKLEELDMMDLYNEVELPLVFCLSDMEKEGIFADKEALKEYGDSLTGRIDELEKDIYSAAGEEFNINSPKQLGVILFEKLELPGAKKTKTGYSTSAEVLDKLAADYKIVSDILEYRQLTKLKSTYADGLFAVIGEDGRIRSTFNQTITATGRISSTEPNLQNIPIRMELGRQIRKVFKPRDGYVFVDADYSQIELRVLAHMSDDKNLIEAYRSAKDIHAITASQVFHVPFDEVTPLQRRNAKAVNFGIVYGISSFGLGQDLGISRKEAQEYIDKYFETYPGIKGYLDKAVEDAKEYGYSTTMFKRRRPIPELKSGNFMQRSFGERVAMNAPIQGTAADIIKIAMIRVHDRLERENLKSKLILQVHDELLIEAEESELEKVQKILDEEMHGAADLKVSLEIDMHNGKTWYDAK
ncbi:MAG: DNA polymerase I [Lachnospiraceae bacterium]|nr:DNA polymerase I [Lachnospiraceae bacterium]